MIIAKNKRKNDNLEKRKKIHLSYADVGNSLNIIVVDEFIAPEGNLNSELPEQEENNNLEGINENEIPQEEEKEEVNQEENKTQEPEQEENKEIKPRRK